MTMSSNLDIDDIEQMYADIIQDTPSINPLTTSADLKPATGHAEHISEAATPAEPLEFVASPIEKNAEVLRTASRRASRSTSRSASRSTSRSRSVSRSVSRRRSSTVEDLAVDMPEDLQKALSTPPNEGQGRKIPSLFISTPTHRSSARLESLIKNGDHEAIRKERESTSMGVLSPNDSDNPENAIMEAIRRASSSSTSRSNSVASPNKNLSSAVGDGFAPSKPPLHRRVSSNVIEETDELPLRPMRVPTGSEGSVAANTAKDPEAAIEKAIRRASSNGGAHEAQSPRTKRLESLASEGSPQQIRAERESTSINIPDPTQSLSPENTIETAFRRASDASSGARGIRRDSTISANLEPDAESAMANAIRRASQSSDRPASIAASRRRSSRLEAIESGDYSPRARRKSSIARRSSLVPPSPSSARRPSAAERLQSISNTGTPDDIERERRGTSEGIVRPNFEESAEDAIANAFRRASVSSSRRKSSSVQPQPNLGAEMEAIARKGTAQEIRAERESTSEGVPDPTDSKNPENVIAKAVADASPESSPDAPVEDAELRQKSLSKRRPSSVSEDSCIEEARKSISEAVTQSPSTASVDPIKEIPEEEALEEVLDEPAPKAPTMVDVGTPPTPAVEFNSDMKVLSPKSATVAKEIDPSTTEPAPAPATQSTQAEESTKGIEAPRISDASTVYLYVSMATGGRGAMKNFQMAQTILNSYKIDFTPVEITMDERARMIWKHRGIAKNKKLPAVVRDGEIKLDFDALLAANEDEEVDEIIFEEF